MVISRIYTENSITSVYAGGIPQLKVAFFPGLQAGSITNNLVKDCETATTIEPYIVSPVRRHYEQPSIQGTDSLSSVVLNMGEPFDTSNIVGYTVPGVVGIGWNGLAAASSTGTIYQVTFQVDCTFDVPY